MLQNYHGYPYGSIPLNARQQMMRARNLKAAATREANRKAKQDAFLAIADNAQFIESLKDASAGQYSGFLADLRDKFNHYGDLSPKQIVAAKNAMTQRAQRDAERAAETERLAAVSNYVGTVGERTEFVLRLDRKFTFMTGFGECTGHIMSDENDNVFVYFGQPLHGEIYSFDIGDRALIKATIKRHDQRDGVKQTVVNRPKVLDIYPGGERETNDDPSADIQAAEAINHVN
jgi:hypothetical protein